jgi:hypothetical protein
MYAGVFPSGSTCISQVRQSKPFGFSVQGGVSYRAQRGRRAAANDGLKKAHSSSDMRSLKALGIITKLFPRDKVVKIASGMVGN